MSEGKRRSGRRRSGGTFGVSLIVIAVLVVMIIQIVALKDKDRSYAQKLDDLHREYQEESERSTEIDALQEYMKSDDYVEDTAKSKLGLAYENEIIYKEKDSSSGRK